MIHLANLRVRTYYLRCLEQFSNREYFDTVCEAGGPPPFANYTWIYVADLFTNRSLSRTLVHELHK